MTDLEIAMKRLWLAYKMYHLASCRNGSDPNEYATACANGYLEYLRKTTQEGENPYDWDIPLAIENQVRILCGFTEIYDRPVKRDKKTLKTRWSL